LLTGKYSAGIPEGSRAAESKWLDDKIDNVVHAKVSHGL
jgi:hypothetical protein